MKLWLPLALLLALPLVAEAQASRPAPQEAKGDDDRDATRLLVEARAKLQALELYEAWDLARVILLTNPKHVLARRIRDAAQVLALSIDAQVVAQRGAAAVLISVGSDDRVREGQVFTVYRGNKAHALVRVKVVRRDSSEAEVIENKGPAVQAGDSVTSAGNCWAWFHEGKQAVLPKCGNARLFREAVSMAEGRRLYDLFRLADKSPKDACLKLYRDAALLAQPSVTGEVTGLDGGVQLNVGRQDGLKRNDLVTFLRRGKVLGRAHVRSLSAGSAQCRVGDLQLEVGDVATTDSKHWPKGKK
jgi:hypothetical protein